MRVRSLISRSPAFWLTPLILILSWLHVQATLAFAAVPYALQATSAATSATFLIAAICGACAAWEGGRLHRAGWTEHPFGRSWLSVALHAMRIPLAIALVCVVSVLVVTFMSQGLPLTAINFGMLGMTFVCLLTHLTLGFALGVVLPTSVAIPALLVFSYAWMILPISIEPVWVRHLTGVWLSCCGIYHMAAPAAIAGAIVANLGLLLGALCLLYFQQQSWRWIAAIGVWVLLWSTGALLVNDLGPDPAVPRTATMVCSDTKPAVCVWPEHRTQLDTAAAMAMQAAQAWQAAGLPVPHEFNEQDQSLLPTNARSFGISLSAQPTDILNALAYAMIPAPPDCSNQPFLGSAAGSYLTAWMAAIAGVPQDKLEQLYGTDVAQQVRHMRTLELNVQREWFEHNLAAWQVCNLAPHLEPQQ